MEFDETSAAIELCGILGIDQISYEDIKSHAGMQMARWQFSILKPKMMAMEAERNDLLKQAEKMANLLNDIGMSGEGWQAKDAIAVHADWLKFREGTIPSKPSSTADPNP